MAAPVSAETLAGAKLWCNITWSDEATDAKGVRPHRLRGGLH